LEYLVNETLAGRGERLKGYNVGLEVFDRPETFDPVVDPLVRIEAARLREKLHEYYDTEGRDDPVRIELPKGGYTPQIEFRQAPTAEREPDRQGPVIAVLPFVNLSGDPKQEYFSDGLTEDIILGLGQFREMVVTARTSSFSYKGRSVPVPVIARELGVAYILEGTVRRVGNRIRITAQLISGSSGESLWARQYDNESEDVFALQDEIVESVVGAFAGQLGRITIERARRKPAANLTSLEFFLQGREQVYLYNPTSFQRARLLLTSALEADPKNAAACAWLAETYWVDWWAGWSADPATSFQLAAEMADRAIALNHCDPHAQIEKGQILLYQREYSQARKHFDRAAQINKYDPDVILLMAFWALFAGDKKLALAKMAEIERLDPHGHYGMIFGMIHFALGAYREAIDDLTSVRAAFPAKHAWLAASHAMLDEKLLANAHAAKYVAAAREAALRAGYAQPSSWKLFLVERHPFMNDEDMRRFQESLSNAGLC
jgi:TolB-like protein